MIEAVQGPIDYDDQGSGPTIVFVPGSFSTGAAWRPVVKALGDRFRVVTTSLLGYGGTFERRAGHDTSIGHEAEVVESVIRRAGAPVHLVGHSFGGAVSAVVCMRRLVDVRSLTFIEAPLPQILQCSGDREFYGQFRTMADGFVQAYRAGDAAAAARVIDFYGGDGAFAAFPPRVRDYIVETTPTNILDWSSVFAFEPPLSAFGAISIPTRGICGKDGHPAVKRIAEILCHALPRASLTTVPAASHFMISTHATQVAEIVSAHVAEAEGASVDAGKSGRAVS